MESGENVRITQAVHEDIYVFSGTVNIEAPVYGDIWCAGGTITIGDTVSGDIVIAGGNIFLRGIVLDDVRAAGGTLTISGNISGDLLVAGGTVTVEPDVVIGSNVAVSGGTVNFGGTTRGNFKSASGTLALNGTVEKDFQFNGGDLQLNGTVAGTSVLAGQNIEVGERAALRGPVRYWTEHGEIDFGNALQNGATATFDPSLRTHFERPDAKFLGFASVMAVLWYLIAAFTVIWLAQWLFSGSFRTAAGTAATDPMRSMGYGFLYFAAVPVAIVILFVTVVGIPVGVIALLFYILLLALANIITALVGAHWIDQRKTYNWRPVQLAFVALGLLVVLHVLGSIPFLGWIIKIAAVFIAYGALLYNSRMFRYNQASG
jgi:phage baseplate assembly protein gpV